MRHPNTTSLSQRLLLALGVVSLLFWVTIAALTTRDNIVRVDELYDVHLARTAKAFLQHMDPDDDTIALIQPVLSPTEIEHLLDSQTATSTPPDSTTSAAAATPANNARRMHYGDHLRYQLWRHTGELLLRSSNAPSSLATAQDGFSDSIDDNGAAWRHYGFHDKHHRVRVIVSEPHAFRETVVRSMLVSGIAPLGLGLPVLFVLLWLSIRSGLHPLDDLCRDISQRQADNLTPLSQDKVPREVRPMVGALNALLQRMSASLAQERRFTDDAAHQLRTPLAAIQAQLYNARHLKDAAEHAAALDQLQLSVARATSLVNQMLSLARLDPQQPQPDFKALDLSALTETICADLAPMALQRNQTLELSVQPDLPQLPGVADLLAMLLSNLLDNAIHYTPPGGQVLVKLMAAPTGLLLSVCDDGPGIPPALHAQVFERFYRIAPHNQPGTGLGLAICQRVAELHHASITLSEGLHGRGLCVQVLFPVKIPQCA